MNYISIILLGLIVITESKDTLFEDNSRVTSMRIAYSKLKDVVPIYGIVSHSGLLFRTKNKNTLYFQIYTVETTFRNRKYKNNEKVAVM